MLATRARMAAGGNGAIYPTPVFVSASSNKHDGATSVTITKPASIAEGDVLVAFIVGNQNRTYTAPSGWTSIIADQNAADNLQVEAYWKVATGAEPASYQWTYSGSTLGHGIILAYRGVDTTAPIDAVAASAVSNATITAPSVTTLGANRLVLAAGSTRSSSVTTPAGTTSRAYEVGGVSFTTPATRVAEFEQAAAGVTGTKTFTAGAADVNQGTMIALKPGS